MAYATSPGVQDVADALSKLLTDPAARQALGNSAAARAATFSWLQTARGHRDVYESLMKPAGTEVDQDRPGT